MSIVKQVNTIDEIYDGTVIIEKPDGTYECPVCKKVYKQLKRAESHLAERDCYDVRTLFKGTDRERKALLLFQAIMDAFYPNARSTISYFRKNKLYGPVVKFSMFCTIHEVKDPELYFAWIRDAKKFKMINAILKHGLNEANLREYRKFLITHPEFINSATFIDQNSDVLGEDWNFFTRSIEKGHMSIVYFLQHLGITFEELILDNDIPMEYANRLTANYELATGA